MIVLNTLTSHKIRLARDYSVFGSKHYSNPRNVLSLPLAVSVIQGLLPQRVPDVWKEQLPDVAEKEK